MPIPTHSPGCPGGAHVNVGNLLPVVAVQSVPQQGLLRELAGERGEGPRVTPGPTPSPPAPPQRACSLDLLDLPLRLAALLLQDRALHLAGAPAPFLLQVLQPAGRGRAAGSAVATPAVGVPAEGVSGLAPPSRRPAAVQWARAWRADKFLDLPRLPRPPCPEEAEVSLRLSPGCHYGHISSSCSHVPAGILTLVLRREARPRAISEACSCPLGSQPLPEVALQQPKEGPNRHGSKS